MNVAQSSWFFLYTSMLGLSCSALGQSFSIEPIQYDKFAGIITLRWATVPERVWSVEYTTNLTDWQEVRLNANALLRVPSSNSNRTEWVLGAPTDSMTFYRIKKLGITDIGTLDVLSTPRLFGVNDGSRIVGSFLRSNDREIGFTWAPGESLRPLTLNGKNSYCVAVNSTNLVVGTTYDASYGFFTWTPAGGIVDRGEGAAVDVNEAGHVLGFETSGQPFIWKPATGKSYLPATIAPNALTDAGHVIGSLRVAGGEYHGAIWTESGGIVDLGGFNMNIVDVNTNLQVVGTRSINSTASPRCFFWSASTGIINFPADTTPYDINNQGQIVGSYVTNGRISGFSWTLAGGFVDLGSFAAADPNAWGCYVSQAASVNDLGRIVGSSAEQAPGSELCLGRAFKTAAGTGLTKLETLAGEWTAALLINNNGFIFGASVSLDGSQHLVMWPPESTD